MKKHLIISLVVGIALSVAALYFAFRNVPLDELFHYLKSINYLWTFPAVILVLISFFIRALRWRFILASSHKIEIWRAFHPLIRFIDNVAAGFILIRYPKKIFICALYSCLVWVSAAFSYYIFSLGSPGIDLSYAQMYAVMVIICLFIVLPSVPGFWGLWEAGGVFAMSIFGVPINAAAGFTLANHAVQVFPVIIVGFISAIITSVNIWQVSYEKKTVAPQTS